MEKNLKIGNKNFNPVLIVKIKDLSSCEIDLILKRMKKIYYYIIPLILLIEDNNSYDLRLEEFHEKIDKRLSRLIFIQKYSDNLSAIQKNIIPKLLRFFST